MKSIRWNNRARKQIKKVPKEYQESIFQSIDQLVDFPNCTGLDIKPLKNHKYDYRMRVGRYRVLFDDENQVQIIAIQEVKNVTTALTNNIQIIEQGGKPAFAVIPWEDYQALIEGMVQDDSDVWFPNEVVKANVRGDSLVKAWREYLGMTQADLAAKAGIKQPALVRIEKIDANPRKSTLVKLAGAMGLTVEQLLE